MAMDLSWRCAPHPFRLGILVLGVCVRDGDEDERVTDVAAQVPWSSWVW